METQAPVEQAAAQGAVPAAPVKRKRVRLPKPSTQLARVLQRLETVVRKHESGEIPISPSRLVDILLEQSRVASILYREKIAADKQWAVTERRAVKARQAREREPAQSVDEPDLSAFMEYHSGRSRDTTPQAATETAART